MKTNLLKLSQEVCGRTEMVDLKRFARPTALCLMQLRSQVLRISMSRRRLFIPVEDRSRNEIPQVIKITHIG
jgi:hypothetical protein